MMHRMRQRQLKTQSVNKQTGWLHNIMSLLSRNVVNSELHAAESSATSDVAQFTDWNTAKLTVMNMSTSSIK